METRNKKSPKFPELGKRIESAIETWGKGKKTLAVLMGVGPSKITNWTQGVNAPTPKHLSQIRKHIGVSLDWLITGEGTPEPPVSYSEADEFVTIAQVRGKISTGGGAIPDNNVEMHVAFRKDWIHRKGLPQNMSLIRVTGDSMEPTFHAGDTVLIDHARNYIDPNGGIYAIVVQGEIMLKRIQILQSSGKARIISDNPKYEPEEIDCELLKINGKVIWFGREIE